MLRLLIPWQLSPRHATRWANLPKRSSSQPTCHCPAQSIGSRRGASSDGTSTLSSHRPHQSSGSTSGKSLMYSPSGFPKMTGGFLWQCPKVSDRFSYQRQVSQFVIRILSVENGQGLNFSRTPHKHTNFSQNKEYGGVDVFDTKKPFEPVIYGLVFRANAARKRRE